MKGQEILTIVAMMIETATRSMGSSLEARSKVRKSFPSCLKLRNKTFLSVYFSYGDEERILLKGSIMQYSYNNRGAK